MTVGLGVLASPVMSDVPRVGKYQLRQLLKRGGMGALYLGYDPELERQVAIKLLRDDLELDSCRERFAREARAIARLRHPNIVTIFDFGVHHDEQYIVMEYIPGETLADLIRRKATLQLERKLQMIEGVCRGLAHAHKAAIVHRDVKPANIMVDVDGTIKVLDFGIARMAAPTLTCEGDLIGSVNYMSPEQLQSGRVDHRSDIFAVGAVLYELVAYAQAFEGDLSDGLLSKILSASPVPLSVRCPEIDPDISAVTARALQKNPDDRYQDLSALGAALAAVRSRIEEGLPRRSAGAKAGRTTQKIATARRKAAVPERRPWLNAGLVLMVVALLVVSVWRTVPARAPSELQPSDALLPSRPLNGRAWLPPAPAMIKPTLNESAPAPAAPQSRIVKTTDKAETNIIEPPASEKPTAPRPIDIRPTGPGVFPLPQAQQPASTKIEAQPEQPPPVITPANTAPPDPPRRAPAAAASDEQQIRGVIDKYVAAMSAKSIEQIESVFVLGAKSKAALIENFSKIKFQRIELLGAPTIRSSGPTATAQATLRYNTQLEGGRPQRQEFSYRFSFQKFPEGWKIVTLSPR